MMPPMAAWLIEKALEELTLMWLKDASKQVDADLKKYDIYYDMNSGLLNYVPKVIIEPPIVGVSLDSSQGKNLLTSIPGFASSETASGSGAPGKVTLSTYQANEAGIGANNGLYGYEQSFNKIIEYLAAIHDSTKSYYETMIAKANETPAKYAVSNEKKDDTGQDRNIGAQGGDQRDNPRNDGTGKRAEKKDEKQDPNKWQSKTLWDNVAGSAQAAWKQIEGDAKKHLQNVLNGTESFSDAFQSVWSLMANKTRQILQERLISHVTDILKDRVLKPINDWLTKTIIDPISKWLGNMIGGLFGMAEGGPVEANRAYIVGERGMELFVPQTAGTIIPNDKLAAGQSQPVTVNVINRTGVQAEAKAETKFDGQRYVVDVFLDAYARNVNGMRDVLAARR